MNNLNDLRINLLSSLLDFTKMFYKLRTGRDFVISQPVSRESHYITITKALMRVFKGEVKFLAITVPPRYGKTELLIHFCPWALANFPDSNFLYVSYSHSLAKKQTQTIRQIVSLQEYKKLFGIEISHETSAKDNFETNKLGSVYAAGSGGTIVGRGAGIQGVNRFGGCIIIDDIIKPDEATSDTIREGVNQWYLNTLQSRVNGPDTPIIYIGQRTHEDDLPANLLGGFDWRKWELVTLPALDELGHALDPSKHTREVLLSMKDKMPYEFAAQYQQHPVPAGGGIFKREWFPLLDEEPNILATLITGDTAETNKTYNDPTVFSFWGIYKIRQMDKEVDIYGLHWLDCFEDWLEPKDVLDAFMQFYSGCLNHKVQPKVAGIEKKSTGSSLISTLDSMQGLRIIDINRFKTNVSDGHKGKTNRFLDIQPYVASKLITLPANGRHSKACIDHMAKITANESHRHDDRADTLADAVDLALIKKIIISISSGNSDKEEVSLRMRNFYNHQDSLKRSIYGTQQSKTR